MALSRREINKDAAQQYVEAGVRTTGTLIGIVVGAVEQFVQQIGALATEVFEISESTKAAKRDALGDEPPKLLTEDDPHKP